MAVQQQFVCQNDATVWKVDPADPDTAAAAVETHLNSNTTHVVLVAVVYKA